MGFSVGMSKPLSSSGPGLSRCQASRRAAVRVMARDTRRRRYRNGQVTLAADSNIGWITSGGEIGERKWAV